MQAVLESIYSSDISQNERKILAAVLKNYDFNVNTIVKVRSAYKVIADKGIFCLKRVSHGYRKAKKSISLTNYLKEKGFEGVSRYYDTREGKTIIKHKDDAFYITYWIEGREADFKNLYEIMRCAELLACFHNHAKGFNETKHIKIRNHTEKWPKTFMKCRNELEKYREYIDRLKLKAEFDYTYRSCISYFQKEAEFAINILRNSKYKELSSYFKNERYVCHDSYYYQNILIDSEGRMFIVDLESCRYDMPVSDVGKLIRRVLSKKRFLWDFDICRRMLDCYCRIRPMAKEEYEILLSMLVFPHKFWKLGKKRYIKNKQWNENRYRKKLKRLLRERQYKREFIYCFIKFYGLNLDYDLYIIEA